MLLTLKIHAAEPAYAGLKTVAGVVARRVFALLQAMKHRYDAQMLASMDDRMLADIGLSRSDLRDAYAEPIWRDPTAVLVTRAYDRHAHRRSTIGVPQGLTVSPSLAPEQPFVAPPTDRPARFAV